MEEKPHLDGVPFPKAKPKKMCAKSKKWQSILIVAREGRVGQRPNHVSTRPVNFNMFADKDSCAELISFDFSFIGSKTSIFGSRVHNPTPPWEIFNIPQNFEDVSLHPLAGPLVKEQQFCKI